MIGRLLAALACLATVAAADTLPLVIQAPTSGCIYGVGRITGATPDIASAIWPDTNTIIDRIVCVADTPPGGGNTWAIDMMTSVIATPNTFAPYGGGVCTISGTGTPALCTSTTTGAWTEDGSASYQVCATGSGLPTTTLHCNVEVAGNRIVHAYGIPMPTSATPNIHAIGSAAIDDPNDGAAKLTFPTVLGINTTRFSVCCNKAPTGAGEWLLRIRRRPVIGSWGNTPVNVSILGASVCQHDGVNTQTWNGLENASIRVTAIGSPASGAVCRAAFISHN